jgi:tRNA dimethylallyltransferase
VAYPLIVIVGPTASGKSELALRLARAHGGEIVSCDSLQVYRLLDVGSAKPSRSELAEIPHHLIDIVDLDQAFSAAEYARIARKALNEIVSRGRMPLLVGGTGLYLRALLDGLFPGPSRNSDMRKRFATLADRHGDARIHRLLAHVDPQAAARIAPRDRVRVDRALEVYWLTGRPISAWQRESGQRLLGFAMTFIGLALPREVLRARVERRTRKMLESGLIDEVRGLLERGYRSDLRPLQAIGYRETVAFIEGRLDRERLISEITSATMRYAKRQMTWFRNQADVSWHPDIESAFRYAVDWMGRK